MSPVWISYPRLRCCPRIGPTTKVSCAKARETAVRRRTSIFECERRATQQRTNQARNRLSAPAKPRPTSAKLIRYFGNAGLGTGLLLRLSHRSSAQADAADCLLAHVDRNSAAER